MVPVRNSRNHVILRRSRLNAKIFLKMHFSTTPTQNHVTFLLFWKVLSYSEFNSASVGPYRTPTQWLYDASRRTLGSSPSTCSQPSTVILIDRPLWPSTLDVTSGYDLFLDDLFYDRLSLFCFKYFPKKKLKDLKIPGLSNGNVFVYSLFVCSGVVLMFRFLIKKLCNASISLSEIKKTLLRVFSNCLKN